MIELYKWALICSKGLKPTGRSRPGRALPPIEHTIFKFREFAAAEGCGLLNLGCWESPCPQRCCPDLVATIRLYLSYTYDVALPWRSVEVATRPYELKVFRSGPCVWRTVKCSGTGDIPRRRVSPQPVRA